MEVRAGRGIDVAALQPIQCACTNLKKAARVVGRAYDQALAPAGVNATQYAILANVGRYQPISHIRLASHLGLERTTLYRAVEILERQRLLTATPTGEGVTEVLTLTPRGQRTVQRARREWEQVQQRFQDAFGSGRWRGFLETLESIRQHFGQVVDEARLLPRPRRPPQAQRARRPTLRTSASSRPAQAAQDAPDLPSGRPRPREQH